MAIDQTPSTPAEAESATSPAIENEFPTYRAISSLAIFSLLLGLASVFSFASLWFLFFTAGSTISGWLAIRKIRKFPEILTGSSFAGAGIGIGLLFGLSAVTHEVVQDVITTMDAKRFANYYVDLLKDKNQPVYVPLWYEQPIEYRRSPENTPEKAAEAVKKQRSPMMSDVYTAKTAGFNQIRQRLKSEKQELRYTRVEKKYIDGLTVYANVLIEVDGPATPDYPSKTYALIQMTKEPGAGPNEWVVQDFKYPYTPQSAAIAVEHKSDDGHGH